MYFCVCVVHSTAEAEGGLQADQKKKKNPKNPKSKYVYFITSKPLILSLNYF